MTMVTSLTSEYYGAHSRDVFSPLASFGNVARHRCRTTWTSRSETKHGQSRTSLSLCFVASFGPFQNRPQSWDKVAGGRYVLPWSVAQKLTKSRRKLRVSQTRNLAKYHWQWCWIDLLGSKALASTIPNKDRVPLACSNGHTSLRRPTWRRPCCRSCWDTVDYYLVMQLTSVSVPVFVLENHGGLGIFSEGLYHSALKMAPYVIGEVEHASLQVDRSMIYLKHVNVIYFFTWKSCMNVTHW